MNMPANAIEMIHAAAGLAVGILLGFAYFTSLHRNVRLFAEGRLAAAGLLQALRFLLLGSILAVMARFGAFALLACAGGLLIGRHLVLRRVEKSP